MTQTNELIARWREIGPIAWCEGPYGWIGEDGQPITLTPWQRAALAGWWACKETCTTLALSNIKKTGKTLTNAVITAWRWLALPGQHFAVGNDLDQAESRSFAMVAEMVKRNPYLAANVKANRNELTFIPTGSRLTTLAVDAAGNAGANHLTASHTEAWGIIYEAGIRAYEELTPPPGKTYGLPALRICDSYAGYEGESITWHTIVDRGLAGERISAEWPIYQAGGLILFHMEGSEARERCYRGTPAEAAAYYAEQQASLRPNAFTRMHNNQRTMGEGAYCTPEQWEACYSGDLRPLQPAEKLPMVLGLDASTSRDYTALVGTVWNDSTGTIDLKHIKVWKPVKIAGIRFGKPTIDLAETIDKEVFRLHKLGLISEIVLDPYQMHSSLIAYTKAGIRVTELAQNAGRVLSDQALYDAINSRSIRHWNDPTLNEHVQAAAGQETPRGLRIVKVQAGRHIDALVALSMSHYGSLKNKAGVEVKAVPDPFANWDDDARNSSGWHIHHSTGATSWRDCKYRSKGCVECAQEWQDEPQYQHDVKRAQDIYSGRIVAMSEEDYNAEWAAAHSPPPPNEEEIHAHLMVNKLFTKFSKIAEEKYPRRNHV